MKKFVKLAKLEVPPDTKAILWDMDGVLIDSLGLDLVVVNEMLGKYFGASVKLSRSYIKSVFAYSVPDFWAMVLEKVEKEFNMPNARERFENIVNEYEDTRQKFQFDVCPGVVEIVNAARARGLKQAVVSNNPTEQVKEVLRNVGLEKGFDSIIGNDISVEQKALKKKPAPDTYLFAAQQLGVPPQQCVVVEDSLIGVEAGKAAGCFVVGVATGGATLEELRSLGNKIDKVYASFK